MRMAADGLPEAAPFDGIIMAAAAPAMLPGVTVSN